ncbi:MAG: TetR/AcrR family transcriptional regulator [Kiritimatiellae bacterium]|nr:TetR/AcrR family transcriptional regulator [Kiritimatiellia bacterium]
MKVAVTQFARSGYAGASVQSIVSAAHIAKPTLYYYFGSKQGLYREVVHRANDECYRLMKEASERSEDVETQLVDILAALFAFTIDNRERTRIVFSAAFVPLAEAEPDPESDEQGLRNFMLVHDIIQNGIKQGVLNAKYTAMDLTRRVYGVLTFEIMVATLHETENPSREDAENIVAVFMHGAANRKVCRTTGNHSQACGSTP